MSYGAGSGCASYGYSYTNGEGYVLDTECGLIVGDTSGAGVCYDASGSGNGGAYYGFGDYVGGGYSDEG